MIRNSERVPLHPFENDVRQHNLIAANRGIAGELECQAAHRRETDLEQVAAIDVELTTQLVEAGVDDLGSLDGQPPDLNLERALMLIGASHQERVPPVLVAHQQHSQLQARERRPGAVGQVNHLGG